MNRKTIQIEIAVGLFLIAGIVSLLVLALQVSGLSHFFKEEGGYKIEADFNNVGGLKNRGKVSIAGVVIGRVVKVQLDPKTFYATVTMSINPKRSGPLPIDSRASIQTAGLLGDNYISLSPGFESTYLQEGGKIPVENTDSALVLEQLVSQFLANQATKSAPPIPEEKENSATDNKIENKPENKQEPEPSSVVKPEAAKEVEVPKNLTKEAPKEEPQEPKEKVNE